jgi:hypothetical protein
MRFARPLFVLGLVATAAWIGSAGAEEPTVQKPVKPQPRVEHPYVDALLGSWSTTATGQTTATGKTQVRLGIGDTTVLQEYASEGKLPDGSSTRAFGHGMYKVSADGRTITAWWLDNYLAEPIRLTGPLTETGFDVTGDAPGGKLRITFERTADGHVMRGYMGDAKTPYVTDVYKRAVD